MLVNDDDDDDDDNDDEDNDDDYDIEEAFHVSTNTGAF